MELLQWPIYFRKGLIARSVEGRGAGAGEVQRKTAGRLPHSAQLPVSENLAGHAGARQVRSLPDRQVPDEALVEDVRLVEVGRGVIATLIDVVEEPVRVVAGFAGKPEGLPVSVRVRQREATCKLVVELNLERVVDAVRPTFALGLPHSAHGPYSGWPAAPCP
jgi:hypothetical protein